MKRLIASLLMGLMVAGAAKAAPATMPPDATFEVGFSPNRGALALVLSEINAAKRQVLVAAYTFSSKPVSAALLDAQKRGVKVFVVADTLQNSKSYTAVKFLANHDLPVRMNGNYAAMHSKYMVIDGQTVQLGSFNYSAAANDKNAENALILRGVPALAQQYAADWQRLWDGGTPVEKSY